jgi:hypothetical protein
LRDVDPFGHTVIDYSRPKEFLQSLLRCPEPGLSPSRIVHGVGCRSHLDARTEKARLDVSLRWLSITDFAPVQHHEPPVAILDGRSLTVLAKTRRAS